MKNGKIGYAVVGLGIGKAHVDAAAAYDRCDLIAVCDLIQEKMDKVVGRYPGTLTYTDFDEMMKNPDIDIVSICLRAPCTRITPLRLWRRARTSSARSLLT